MKGFLALCDTSPTTVLSLLADSGYRADLVLPKDKEALDNLGRLDVALVVNTSTFIKYQNAFLDWGGVAIIFDSPPKCDSLLGIHILDVQEKLESYRYRFQTLTKDALITAIQSAFEGDDDVMFDHVTLNVASSLLNTVSSQMSRVQSIKYAIHSDLRDDWLKKLVSWFFSNPSVDQARLRKALDTLLEHEPYKERLHDKLFVTDFMPLKLAIIEATEVKKAGKTPVIQTIADTHGVSAFDVRYILAVRQKHLLEDATPRTLADMTRASRATRNVPPPVEETD